MKTSLNRFDFAPSLTLPSALLGSRPAPGVPNSTAARLPQVVERLNRWIDDNKPPVRKIQAAAVPGYRLAAVAAEDIAPEEVYLAVPRSVIMSVETAERSSDLRPVLSVRHAAPRRATRCRSVTRVLRAGARSAGLAEKVSPR